MAEIRAAREKWRTFVAIELPGDLTNALSELRSQMPPQEAGAVRWIRPEGIHLTLSFLGDVDADLIPAISERLSDAAGKSGPFTLDLAGVGAFPSLRRPRVFWVGLSGETDRLRSLHSRVQGALSHVGFAPERRRFDPHLTVGRIRRDSRPEDARPAGAAFGRVTLPQPAPSIPVDSTVLFRSHLKPGGAEYERLFEAPLG